MQKPKPSEFVLEIRCTSLGPRAEPLYSATGRDDGAVVFELTDLPATQLRGYLADFTSEVRKRIRKRVRQIDRRTWAEIWQYAKTHHLTKVQAIHELAAAL